MKQDTLFKITVIDNHDKQTVHQLVEAEAILLLRSLGKQKLQGKIKHVFVT